MLKTFFNVQVGFFNYLKQTREREKTWVIVSPDVTIFSISFFLSLDWCLTCIWHSSFSILIGALKSTYLFLSLSIYFLLQLFVFFFTSCLCSLSFILYDAVVFLSRHCMSLSLSLIRLFVSCFCMFMKEAYRLKNQGSKTFCCDSWLHELLNFEVQND